MSRTAELLPSPERFLSPRQRRSPIKLPADPNDEELARDWTLSEQDKAEVLRCRGEAPRRRFAAQLCALSAHGRFLGPQDEVPVAVLNHLASQLELSPVIVPDPPPRENTDLGHQRRLRRYRRFQPWEAATQESIEAWAYEKALLGILPRPLFGMVERELVVGRRVVLPAPSTLERLVVSACSRARERTFAAIAATVPPGLGDRLDTLLEATDTRHSRLLWLKAAPPEAKPDGIRDFMDRMRELQDLGVPDVDLGWLAPEMVSHLAGLTSRYHAQALRRFATPKRHALLACYVVERYRWLLDQLVEMHGKYLTRMSRAAELAVVKRRQRLTPRNRYRKSLDLLHKGLRLVLSRFDDEEVLLRSDFYELIDEAKAKAAVDTYQKLCRVEDRGYLDALSNRHSQLRRYLPDFLSLPFQASPGSEPLLEAIRLVRDLPPRKSVPSDINPRLVPPRIRQKLWREDGSVDRRLFEVGTAMTVKDALKGGDLFLPASKRHVSFSNMVYSDERWSEERGRVYPELDLPEDPDAAISRLRAEFGRVAREAEAGLDSNAFAEVRSDGLHLHRGQEDRYKAPRSVENLRSAFQAQMPRVRIENLVWEIDKRCGFLGDLKALSGVASRIDNLDVALPAALIALGTNLGIASMGRSNDQVSVDSLQRVARWFLREDALRAANGTIVDYINDLPFSQVWGSGSFSSSDGQRFGIRGRSLLGSFYPRYFGYYERAVTFYTHTSDQLSVYSTQVISCSEREALYVLEGLLEQDTGLEHREHTTDTHGYTEQLFGLCYLLGFSFMPRIADLADQQLYRLRPSERCGRLEPVFRATVDTGLIAEQWDQLVRVAASLKRRTARPHDIMRRLASSSPADRLAKALTALGRVVKTIHILRYVHDSELRHRIQTQLNRGESRHALAKKLFFSEHGELLKGDYEEVMSKASCLSILSNAVTAWNIEKMEQITKDLREAGRQVDDEDLAHAWPLQHRHVVPHGTYRFPRS